MKLQKHLSLIFVIFFGILICELHSAESDKKASFQLSSHILKVDYCYSCGYKKAFEDYANILNEKFPDLLVIGDNYNPSGFNFYLSKAILIIKLLLIIAVISNYDVFGFFGQPTPAWYRWATENKLYACMMSFFLGNMLEAQLVSSGAFEISLDDVPIWSKLSSGRICSPSELFQILESHLQFTETVEKNPDFVK